MSKAIKKIVALGALGGSVYGVYKMKQKYDYLKETYNDVILFRGERLVYDEVFEGDEVAVVCSGLEIDMTDMILEEDNMNLDIYGIGSGIRILLPEGIHVAHNGTSKGSGVDVSVATYANDDILTLNINYDLSGCGLQIITKYDDYEEEVETETEAEQEDVSDTQDMSNDQETDNTVE